ncbi:unnamed protein product [Urochloa humidicola]
MGQAAKRSASRRSRKGRQGTEETSFLNLPDDTLTDIFLRLPAKSVLLAGAVCKAWRSITTNPSFAAAHARLQPTQVVIYKYLDDAGPYEVALDVTPFSGNATARRRLICYPRIRSMLLLASCDGVLLFSKPDNGSFLLCNPTTWQWAELPRLPQDLRVAGVGEYQYAFYYHKPSDEFRLLLRRRGHSWPRASSWHILSTGATDPRRVAAVLPAGASMTNNSLVTAPPVALNGWVHWPPRVVAATVADARNTATKVTTEMVVFGTVSETFGRMAGPPTATADLVKLFDMEGHLAAADFGEEQHVDLWFLEDYGAGRRWERRRRVATAWPPGLAGIGRGPPRLAVDMVCVAAAGDGEGNVMLGSHIWLVAYNLRTRTTRTVVGSVAPARNVLVSRHVFSESLVRHPAFAARSAADLGVTFSWC